MSITRYGLGAVSYSLREKPKQKKGPILNPSAQGHKNVLKITHGALNARPKKLENIKSSPNYFLVMLVLAFICISKSLLAGSAQAQKF